MTCDGCGPAVMALVIVELDAGVLSFCGHHFDVNAAALQAGGWVVTDLREKVPASKVEAPAAS